MRLDIVPNPITYSNARRSAVVAGHAVSSALVIRAILAGHILSFHILSSEVRAAIRIHHVLSGLIIRIIVIIRNIVIIEPVNNIVHSIDPIKNGHITGNFYSSQ